MIRLGLALVMIVLAGCSVPGGGRYQHAEDHGPAVAVDLSHVPDAVPRDEPRSRSGNGPVYVVNGRRYRVMESARGYRERGIASWYGNKFHGHRTANGEIYDMYGMTAAHKTLPLPSYVRVTNLANGRSVVVRVNDRGPFHPGRIIDLSYAAAYRLGMVARGTAEVLVEAVFPDQDTKASEQHFSRIPTTLLQLGAFSSRAAADRLARQVREQFPDYPVRVTSRAPDQRIFRVRMGPFPSSANLERIRSQLQALGVPSVPVVDLP